MQTDGRIQYAIRTMNERGIVLSGDALTGGTDTFSRFLTIGYDAFSLSKTDAIVLTGRPVFPGAGSTTTAEEEMARHGLVHKSTRMLDASVNCRVEEWVPRRPMKARRLRLVVKPGMTVSALYQKTPDAAALLVFAHGAGAGMSHPFMAAVADRLAEAGVSTLRFQFPYMEAGSKRPDRPAIAHAAVRAAVSRAAKLAPGLPLFAGGKSFGGRMTSQAQALEPLPDVRGLVFLGFPLHRLKNPRSSGRPTFSTSLFRNCSFRARGTRWPSLRSCEAS